MEPIDPADLRVSDADRERVAEVLREAAGDGRIDFAELDERLEATYAAKTYRDLVPITVDLPGQHVPVVARPTSTPARLSPPGVPATHGVSFAMMSETRRAGAWDIGRQHTAAAVMGSVVIDLRQARFPDGEVRINATAVMGSVEVLIDAHTRVVVQGVGIMGVFAEGHPRVEPETDDASPFVRLTGMALMGSVEVHRREAPGGLDKGSRTQLGP